ncbi:MAG: iron transporter FeoA [Deltaproteobacteria bacterium]|jgi:ferrous iron transport protein A|nr:MAG: iron transporter FeoA [Deltaproteobacteria bacterium]
MKRIIKMRNMSDNQAGIITKINVAGEMGRRIRDMGLVKGTPIQVIGRAPLYDPVAIKVRDYTLTLRNNEADFIEAEVDDEEKEWQKT